MDTITHLEKMHSSAIHYHVMQEKIHKCANAIDLVQASKFTFMQEHAYNTLTCWSIWSYLHAPCAQWDAKCDPMVLDSLWHEHKMTRFQHNTKCACASGHNIASAFCCKDACVHQCIWNTTMRGGYIRSHATWTDIFTQASQLHDHILWSTTNQHPCRSWLEFIGFTNPCSHVPNMHPCDNSVRAYS